MMEKDEEGTLAQIKSLQREVIEPKLRDHHGRLVKITGDGFLIEFASPVEAVRCAVAIQETLASTPLQLRVGINLGDIIVEPDGDVYGDGVNVAARLEGLSDPGGILISGPVYDQIEGKVDRQVESRGEQQVKNITKPVRVYALASGKRTITQSTLNSRPLLDKPAIAVLPFANMSGDLDQVYFSDGITDDVITELSRFRELLVIARNSSFSFRGKSIDVREIGRALGAAYVLEGTVRRAGDRVRVTAQLVDAESGAHLWAERYDRALEDVFAVQEEIARSIVTTVVQRVIDAGEIAGRRRCPEDMRAYDIFLKALRFGGTSFAPEALAQLEALYHQVLALDPTFARAYSGLAFVNRDRSVDAIRGVQAQPDEHMLTAMRFAEQALALDSNDPRVQCTFALMCSHVRNFERAERHFDIALAMNPNDATVQIFSSWLRSMRGKRDQGVAAAEMAYRLNPRHPSWYDMILGRLHFQKGQYDKAASLLERVSSDAPARALRDLGWRVAAYGHLGLTAEAARWGDELVRGMGSHWKGNPDAGPADYMDWVVWSSLLEQPEDQECLRAGLRLAGLPA
jgi:TolB-like protein/Tfp pilus assembly protein PilF